MKNQKNNDLELLRHSTAHLMMQALYRLYGAIPGVGPAIENGFYHDFEAEHQVTEDDLAAIEKEMQKIIKENIKIERLELSIDDGLKLLKEKGYKYTLELAEDLKKEGEKKISFYEQGDFINMCRGPHLDSTGQIKNFQLISLAGAYWKGSEKNKMLQRIYGTAFETKEEIKEYLEKLSEAKKRDHRKIGKEQELFFIDELVGKGLVMWQPKGTIIKNEIESLAIAMEDEYGYQRVSTPHLAKEELYLTSGHLPYYKDSMYPAMVMDDGTYYLKAMNCPHHHMIYKHQMRSYRDLPLRLAEYGTVYRNELSGTLAGLLRVRCLAMNDAHIYCRKDQIKAEFQAVLELTLKYFTIFGLKDYYFRLSKWNPANTEKYINEPANWEYSQNVIKEILDEAKVEYEEADDEAAFYGPKIDIQFKSIIGREETMATIQLDFLAKERFNLHYIDNGGKENNEVFVIHRAPLSTHERFIAFLIEYYAGIWPVWLSPVQVRLITISEKFIAYSQMVLAQIKAQKIRVDLDASNESLGKRIRTAEKEKIPYILVIGEKEEIEKTVAVRKRGEGDQGSKKIDEFTNKIKEEIEKKK